MTRAGMTFETALAGAARRASRVAGGTIGRGHLLESTVRLSLGARIGLGRRRRHLSRLISSGVGLTREMSHLIGGRLDCRDGEWVAEVDGLLNEARWDYPKLSAGRPDYGELPRWAPETRRIIARALTDAQQAGVSHAGILFLLDAVLNDSLSADILLRCGVDPGQLMEVARRYQPEGALEDQPATPVVRLLEYFKVTSGGSEQMGLFSWGLRRMMRRESVDALAFVLEHAATREAVRLGCDQVASAHLLLATVALDEELALADAALPHHLAPVNLGGQMLAHAGMTRRQLIAGFCRLRLPREPALPQYTKRDLRKQSPRWWRKHPKDPPWTEQAFAAAERGIALAVACGADYGSTHLLIGALSDADASARRLLEGLGVDARAILETATESLHSCR